MRPLKLLSGELHRLEEMGFRAEIGYLAVKGMPDGINPGLLALHALLRDLSDDLWHICAGTLTFECLGRLKEKRERRWRHEPRHPPFRHGWQCYSRGGCSCSCLGSRRGCRGYMMRMLCKRTPQAGVAGAHRQPVTRPRAGQRGVPSRSQSCASNCKFHDYLRRRRPDSGNKHAWL